MKRPCPIRTAALFPVCALLALPPLAQAGKAHVHGLAKLDVAVDGAQLTLMFSSPMDNLLGFEHRPRTDAQKRAGEALLAQLKDGGPLFKPDAAAGCTAGPGSVSAPTLEPPKPGAREGEHADLEATWVFTCRAPDKLAALEHELFARWRRISSIEVQVAGATRQSQQTLRRPARSIKLR